MRDAGNRLAPAPRRYGSRAEFEAAALAWIAEHERILREQLGDVLIVTEPFSGVRPVVDAERAFDARPGQQISRRSPIAARYAVHLRPFTEAEIESQIASAISNWRYQSGLK